MPASRKKARVGNDCVACGRCVCECPVGAISIYKGLRAVIDERRCVACENCAKACPAGVIYMAPEAGAADVNAGAEDIAAAETGVAHATAAAGDNAARTKAARAKAAPAKKKRWYDYLWIFSSVYLALGFFNILFAWLGMACFLTPLLISIIGGSKAYCNKYCGRGQLFELIGGKIGLSSKRVPPRFLRSKWFRYGFLTFFMTMFGLMVFNTYLVFAGAPLTESVTLLWVFKLPWHWTETAAVSPWIAQYAFGFYGVMLTSTVLGLATMILFKPRSWCAYCPMGTMTQEICALKRGKK